jgi:Flp pilus assembly protein TadG
VALSIDVVYAFMVKAALVTAVDAAALAGARAIPYGQQAVTDAVHRTFDANLPANRLVVGQPTYAPNPPVITVESGTRSISLTGTARSPTFFLRLFGYTNGWEVKAIAKGGRRDINVMLVLDRSTSLVDHFDDVQNASTFFVNQFDDTRDNVGLVSFGTNSRVERTPQTGFKAPLGTMIHNMRVISTTYTNLALGLYLGYNELRTLNGTLAQNVIVFFTDGLPTTMPGQFDVEVSTTHSPRCASTPQDGVFIASGGVTGIWRLQPTAPLGSWTSPEHTIISDCTGLQSNGSNGTNLLTGGFRNIWTPPFGPSTPISVYSAVNPSVTLNGITESNITAIGGNLFVNVAEKARLDPLKIRILVIGLGNGVNTNVLKRVANVSPYTVSGQEVGLYVYAPDSTGLMNAFRQVASSIAHLMQ